MLPRLFWHVCGVNTRKGPANRPLPVQVTAETAKAAQRRPELFELEFDELFEDEFEELFEELLDELFEELFEDEFEELFELELLLELLLELDEPFEELLDELLDASCSLSSAAATRPASGAAMRACAPSMPTVTSATPASVVAVIIFFMSLSCCGRPSRGWS